jgi:hypothetical protein
MNQELQQKLFETYPNYFGTNFYIECEDGWYDILDTMLYTIKIHENQMNQIKELYPDGKTEYIQLYFLQIKEKFGTLRIYATGGNFYTRGVIDMAERMGSRICEFSGNKGKIRNKRIDPETGETFPAWVKCMSDDVAKKEGYK